MTLRLIIQNRAEKDLRTINKVQRDRIIEALDRYAWGGAVDLKKLRGHSNLWRIRVGEWRIIMQVNNTEALILKIERRGEAYQDLDIVINPSSNGTFTVSLLFVCRDIDLHAGTNAYP